MYPSLPRLILRRLSDCLGFLFLLSQIELQSLPLNFWNKIRKNWALNWIKVKLFILRVMVHLRIQFKCWKTCFRYVSWILVVTRTSFYLLESLYITIIIIQGLTCLFLRLYIEGGIDLVLSALVP